jgi:DNA (cytosine-5)-methyltransferase 1
MSYKSIELFAGAGGLALGFEEAGFENKLVLDNDMNCINTLKHNRPNWNVICSYAETYNYFFNEEIDVVTGGFPCQTFSHAGKRQGFDDIRGTAFHGFAKAIGEIKPKMFVAENVRGLATHDKGFTLQTILSVFGRQGYNVKYEVLNSIHYHVPQKRERTIIIGIRNDINNPNDYEFPSKSNDVITVGIALYNVPFSEGMEYSHAKRNILAQVPEGGNWRDLPKQVAKDYMKKTYMNGGGNTGVAKRLCFREPSPTIVCSPMQKTTERCHPIETRPLTIRESARIQTFPDNWEFTGSIASQYKQIGNAVPVRMALAIGVSVRTFLDTL